MRTILTSWGCVCLVAANVAEALDAVRSASRRPDILLADYRLADGVTGIEVIEAVSALVGDVPAILVTGATDLRQIGAAHGSTHRLLHKPLKSELLRMEIERLLTRGAAANDAQEIAAAPAPR